MPKFIAVEEDSVEVRCHLSI